MKNEICCFTSRISHTSEIYWFGECSSVLSILPTLEHLAQDRNFSCQFLCFHAYFPRSKKPVRLLAGTSTTWSSSGELWCSEQDSLIFWRRLCMSWGSPIGLPGPWNVLSPGQSLLQDMDPGVWGQAADSHTLSDSLQLSGNWSDDSCPASAQESQTGDRTGDKNVWGIALPGLRHFFLLFLHSRFHFPFQPIMLPCAASLLALLWFFALSCLLFCFQSSFPRVHSYDYMAVKLMHICMSLLWLSLHSFITLKVIHIW